MNLLLTSRIALRALRKNKMRASLTVLGVVIGIAAVTAMVSIGQSASRLVQTEFESFGPNLLVIFNGSRQGRGVHQGRGSRPSLTSGDCLAIAEECPSVMAQTPIVGAGGQVIYGNMNWSPNQMVGVGLGYLTVRNSRIGRGDYFSEHDIASAAKVCVLGTTVVAKLFQTTDPLDKTVRIGAIPFRVIGVLESKGANLAGEDQDNVVLAPYSTIRKRIRRSRFDNVDVILVSARTAGHMIDAQHEIQQLLYERHDIAPGESPDFEVENTSEIAKVLDTITMTMTALLSSIAAISLLVGGVGIMNIMLVSVTERTREIGIRMAVGARGRDILWQFLVEAIFLSSIGGVVGIALGVSASIGIVQAINTLTSGTEWPIVISVPAAIVALLFAGGVGIVFGFFPALRASRLDPIEALRYE